MATESDPTPPEVHRKLAADLFNLVWTLLEKPVRTRDEDDTMLHAAHASRYHWDKVGGPVNLARGEWQIARVYSVLERTEPTLHHARRCLEICLTHSIEGFDLAYAFEAMARAAALSGDSGDRDHYLSLAREQAARVTDGEHRALLDSDLTSVPAARLAGGARG